MTDAELIECVRNDDPQGLSFIYETFHSEFIHWVIKFAKCDEEDAREYYQATVLIFYDNARSGKLQELKSSLKTYLFGIGKNLTFQRHRQEARMQKAGAEFYLQQHVQQEEEGIDNLELVSRCFRQLGEPCHSLLDLFYFQKKGMDEIALTLNYKNTDTAKNQKYKCM